jgi:hypothetical protein
MFAMALFAPDIRDGRRAPLKAIADQEAELLARRFEHGSRGKNHDRGACWIRQDLEAERIRAGELTSVQGSDRRCGVQSAERQRGSELVQIYAQQP